MLQMRCLAAALACEGAKADDTDCAIAEMVTATDDMTQTRTVSQKYTVTARMQAQNGSAEA